MSFLVRNPGRLKAELAALTADRGSALVAHEAVAYPPKTAGGAAFTTVWGDGVTNVAASLTAANALGLPIRIRGVCVVSTPVTITVPIIDTTAQIFAVASSANVTIDNGLPVRVEWFGVGSTGHGDRAVAALPASGGTVLFRARTYDRPFVHAYGGGYLSKDNVTLQGAKMPALSNDCRSLQGGTILRGMLLAYANNFEARDLGVDCGRTTVVDLFGGVVTPGVTEGLLVTYPSEAIKTAAQLRRNVRLHNVIGLGESPSAAVHAIIIGEGVDGVSCTGQVVGAMALHPLVIKCACVMAEQLEGYLGDGEGLIIKSDAQATAIARDIQIDKVVLRAQGPAGLAPYVASVATDGLVFEAQAGGIDKVTIGQVNAVQYVRCVTPRGTFPIDGVSIETLLTDQFGVAGNRYGLSLAAAAGQQIRRWQIGTIEARNATASALVNFQQSGTLNRRLSIGAVRSTSCTYALVIAGQSYVDIGSVSTDACTDAVYNITGTPKLMVGTLEKDTATPQVYSTTAGGLRPALSNSWAQVAANDPFGVDLLGGKIHLRGLVRPGTSNIITTLPQWAWPLSTKRFLAQAYNGTTQVAVPLVVGSNGVVTVNEIAGGFANCSTWLSLSGVSWDAQQ